jgi:putative N6-adenine-specific DNA methylase
MTTQTRYSFYVSCPPGLETLLTAECRELKFVVPQKTLVANSSDKGEPGEDHGGFELSGTLEHIYKANLMLRTASRVVVRLGEYFAASFSELRKEASRLDWKPFIRPGQRVNIRVTCHKSKLYHSDAVAERILGAINDHFTVAGRNPRPITSSSEGQLIIVRLLNDICTISIDSSGELLYKRGYKQAVAKAPLRENIAAAMIRFSGWDTASPLIDPFCGSGTIPIESAQMACKVPPGISRAFRFSDWPVFDKEKWNGALEGAKKGITDSIAPIYGYDRDSGAIEFSQANAARAGQKNNIKFLQQAVSYLESPAKTGTIVTNPPYGVRTKESNDLRDLYARFGSILLEKFNGWIVVMLSPDDVLTGNLGLSQPDETLRFLNGGLPVKMLKYKL